LRHPGSRLSIPNGHPAPPQAVLHVVLAVHPTPVGSTLIHKAQSNPLSRSWYETIQRRRPLENVISFFFYFTNEYLQIDYVYGKHDNTGGFKLRGTASTGIMMTFLTSRNIVEEPTYETTANDGGDAMRTPAPLSPGQNSTFFEFRTSDHLAGSY
jgi:hypothetical protein